ncbi:SDR family oxidoreductase [Parathalassolituus penaei]|uniref:SDR family oxidoreductase n=1 Tax=Parathalassolituus penaei TaxID=2997323 RepID=A0A9X3EDU1_9GAMM|nr:SDR family oxidoreductase [Parathalassolituus penaei]MCY0965742.1 SDR family oxidoreductase [Parathalassolituus penaei]
MIVVTGANGQLGQLVINELLKTVPASDIVAAVRTPSKAADLAALGVTVKEADYTRPETLEAAFAGADKVLLISSSEVGQRYTQHLNVIAAAKQAGVGLLAYTSILKADSSPLPLALEHKQTEAAIAEAGIPAVILRNGWYTENYLASVPVALQYGVVLGCANDGRIASAARADYAAAAAAVLTSSEPQAGKVYELAGDESYSLTEFAAAIAAAADKPVAYQNLPQEAYTKALLDAGLPDFLATLLAESDTGASHGGLFDDSKTLSQLIGRPTTSLSELVKAAVAG